jgi:hypothetical protein
MSDLLPKMAMRELSVFSYTNGLTLWCYKSSNEPSEILTPNFFAAAANMFATGDSILVATPAGNFWLSVAVVDSGAVIVKHFLFQ